MKPRLVVLSGAGISAESGLRTFRDSDGLWEGYAIEDVATPGAWKAAPERVLAFYNERRRNVASAKPNAAHEGLAALEQYFDVRIITQNIDDLHERAGSSRIMHLHGQIFRMRSEFDPSLSYEVREDMFMGQLAPDGSQLRPDIVWFEEPVPLIEDAALEVAQADIFLVIGTSLVVYPAAGLLHAVSPETVIYLMDTKIPMGLSRYGITTIEKPATEGMVEFTESLMRDARWNLTL
jgi:NAD-dependent deacetylase